MSAVGRMRDALRLPAVVVPAVVVPALVAAACTTVPSGPAPSTVPGTPSTTGLTAVVATSAPSVLTFAWTATDPEGDPLTCTLDTDDDGAAEVTLGACSGARSRNVTVTSPGTRTARLTVSDGTHTSSSTTGYSVVAGTTESMDIVVRPIGSLGTSATAAFADAAARWEQVVHRGITDVSASVAADTCADGAAPIAGTIDDLLIDAEVAPIDGVGGVLGQAGPCLVHTGDGLTRVGVMRFDSADVAQMDGLGILDEVVRHEMGHVLGFGTLWGGTPLLRGSGTADPRYGGPAGTAEWSELGGTGRPPLEADGGTGTAEAHWAEATFGPELMTGWIEGSAAMPLSRMSIAALADLGYRVDLSTADAFTLPALLRAAPGAAPTALPGTVEMLRPIGTIPGP
jgi:hypothetical protein